MLHADSGWTGTDCDVDVNECATCAASGDCGVADVCVNGACTNNDGSFSCAVRCGTQLPVASFLPAVCSCACGAICCIFTCLTYRRRLFAAALVLSFLASTLTLRSALALAATEQCSSGWTGAACSESESGWSKFILLCESFACMLCFVMRCWRCNGTDAVDAAVDLQTSTSALPAPPAATAWSAAFACTAVAPTVTAALRAPARPVRSLPRCC